MASLDDAREKAVSEHLQVINEVLQYCGFSERVRVPEECTPSMFICLFESLFRAKLSNIKRHPKKFEDHLHNCHSILDVLANHVLKVDLSYIVAEDICQGDHQSIMLLIEIFYELMKIVVSRKNNENKAVEPNEHADDEERQTEERTQSESDLERQKDEHPDAREKLDVPSPIPHISTPPVAHHVPSQNTHVPYSSTPPPLPSPSRFHARKTQQHVFAKNIPRMPSPIKTLRDSGSSLSSSGPSSYSSPVLSYSSGPSHSSPVLSSSSAPSHSSPLLSSSRNQDRIKTARGSPRSPGVTKEYRRETRREEEEGNENQDSNVMFSPPPKAPIGRKKGTPTKSPRSQSGTPKKKAGSERQREHDELVRCVDNIDREIRATEEARHHKSLSPAKHVHFTPSLNRHNRSDSSSSDQSSSFTEEDQQSFKESIKFHGSDKGFYEDLLDSIPENVPRYVWENPLRQWLKIRPMTSPDKAQRVAYAKEQEMAHRTSELVQSMIKDYEASKRRSEHLDRVRKRAGVQADIRDRREQLVRLQKMDAENELERKSRVLKRQSHEELLYKNLFAQSLKIQKQRIIEERKDSRERKEEYERQCAIKQQSIENYYLQQYDLLRTQMGEETRNQQISEHAQQVALKKMEAELKHKMKAQLELLKEQLRNEEELSYFRLFDSQKLYDALTHH